jgi:hypothetical protein
MIFVLYLIAAIISAVLNYGMTKAYFDAKYPQLNNVGVAIFTAFLGTITPIIGLVCVFFLSERCRYGLKYGFR